MSEDQKDAPEDAGKTNGAAAATAAEAATLNEATGAESAPGEPGLPKTVRWDDSNMSSSYANVVNVLATREELTLLFGTNQTWNALGSDELVVRLSDRIVLTPYAAKRLAVLLNRRVLDYEQRFGKLDL